jgi:hypothetical protein
MIKLSTIHNGRAHAKDKLEHAGAVWKTLRGMKIHQLIVQLEWGVAISSKKSSCTLADIVDALGAPFIQEHNSET